MTFRRAAVVITSALRLSYTNLKIQNLIIQNAHSAQFKTQNSKFKTPITSHSAAQTNRHRHGRICSPNTMYRRHL